MKKSSHFIINLLLIILPIFSFAQRFTSGSITTLDGKTITGFIKKQGQKANCLEVKFKKDKNSQVKLYRPDELKSYQFDDKEYESAKLQLFGEGVYRDIFLKRMVEGEVELFRLDYEVLEPQSPFYQYETAFYVIKNKEETVILHQENYLIAISRLQKECTNNLAADAKKYRYTDISMAKTVMDLNACIDESSRALVPLDNSNVKRFIKYGLSVGMLHANAVFGHPQLQDFTYNKKAQAIIGVFVNIPLGKKGLSLKGGFHYLRYKPVGEMKVVVPEFYVNSGEILVLESEIYLKYLAVPIELKYTFPTQSIRPYLFGGIHFGVGNNNTVTAERTGFIPPDTPGEKAIYIKESFEPFNSTIANFNLAWKTGLGLTIPLTKKLDLFVEASYGQYENASRAKTFFAVSGNFLNANIGLEF